MPPTQQRAEIVIGERKTSTDAVDFTANIGVVGLATDLTVIKTERKRDRLDVTDGALRGACRLQMPDQVTTQVPSVAATERRVIAAHRAFAAENQFVGVVEGPSSLIVSKTFELKSNT